MENQKNVPVAPVLNEPAPEEGGVFSRMFYKVKKDPAVVIGMSGWTALVGYSLYNIRKRKTTLPLYLIDVRMKAQMFVIGSMMSVVFYRIFVHEKNKFGQKQSTKE